MNVNLLVKEVTITHYGSRSVELHIKDLDLDDLISQIGYLNILEAMPADDIAKFMNKKIEELECRGLKPLSRTVDTI
jgi:hypothetical protein